MEVNWECEHCGDDTLVEVMVDAVVYTPLVGISYDEDSGCIDKEYGNQDVDYGSVSCHQCSGCGKHVDLDAYVDKLMEEANAVGLP